MACASLSSAVATASLLPNSVQSAVDQAAQGLDRALDQMQAADRLYQDQAPKQATQSTRSSVVSFDGQFADCQDELADGQAPSLVGSSGAKLNRSLHALCFEGFATLYSGVSYTPFWSASHLTKKRVQSARALARVDNFHPELRLPKKERAELQDYRRSGFDRGHVAPNGDMATSAQQYDSFSLANIAPQDGEHNRNLWRQIESVGRDLAVRHGEVYVVTGVAFLSPKTPRLNGKVMVPSHFFKAIYIPKLGQAGVYFSPNDASGSYRVISLDELCELTGIDVMPSLPASVQAQAYDLPVPTDRQTGHRLNRTVVTDADGILLLVVEFLKFVVDLLNDKA